MENPADFNFLGKDYDEEKKETPEHQEVFKLHKQDCTTEKDT